MVASVRAGQEIPRFYPPLPANVPRSLAPAPPEFEAAATAIRESTGLEIDKDVWGAEGRQACINTKLTGPKGTRTVAFILEHHGERYSAESKVTNTVQQIGLDRTCNCVGRRGSATCVLMKK